jgi:hypothetical protein
VANYYTGISIHDITVYPFTRLPNISRPGGNPEFWEWRERRRKLSNNEGLWEKGREGEEGASFTATNIGKSQGGEEVSYVFSFFFLPVR